MESWPKSWAGTRDDVPVGVSLVEAFRPFVSHLQQLGLASRTVRHHFDNLWLLGGEIIRGLNDDSARRKRSARALLLDAIESGEAPLVRHLTEEEQVGLDATARKLLKFLSASNRQRAT